MKFPNLPVGSPVKKSKKEMNQHLELEKDREQLPEEQKEETIQFNPFPETSSSLLQKQAKVLLADKAMTMVHMQSIGGNIRKHDAESRELGMAIARHNAEKQGVEIDEPEKGMGGDAMEVRFDSPQTTHNYYPAPEEPVKNEKPVKKGIGTLGKVLIGGVLAASGIGIGAAIPFILDALKSKETPAQVHPTHIPTKDTDTDTWIEIDI